MAGAFKRLVGKLEKKGLPGGEREAKAIAANIGRAKYGKAGMERKAAAGRARAKGK